VQRAHLAEVVDERSGDECGRRTGIEAHLFGHPPHEAGDLRRVASQVGA
jgi:hypothetical protein